MRSIVLFCEDVGHEKVIKALIEKMLVKESAQVKTLSARHGKGRALAELEKYLKQIERGQTDTPDAIVAAIDANCKGYQEKRNEIDLKIPKSLSSLPILHAIPSPHIERWLLLDSQAFKLVFGKGCNAPDQKCEKDRYKSILRDAITSVGATTLLGGIEYAEEIIGHMEIAKMKIQDDSLKKFIEEIENLLLSWNRGSAAG